MTWKNTGHRKITVGKGEGRKCTSKSWSFFSRFLQEVKCSQAWYEQSLHAAANEDESNQYAYEGFLSIV